MPMSTIAVTTRGHVVVGSVGMYNDVDEDASDGCLCPESFGDGGGSCGRLKATHMDLTESPSKCNVLLADVGYLMTIQPKIAFA